MKGTEEIWEYSHSIAFVFSVNWCGRDGNHSTIPIGEKDRWQGRVRLGSDESINHALNIVFNNVLDAVEDIKYVWCDSCPQR